MISKDLINSRLGIVLSRLGKPVCNAALYKEELGVNCPTDQEILAEYVKYLEEVEADKNKLIAYNAALSEGFDTGLGFNLSVTEYAQTRFSVLMTGLRNLSPSNETVIKIWDKDKVEQKITYAQFKAIMQGYTLHCMEA